MSSPRYERAEDAQTRLDGSILFYKGVPAYIRTSHMMMSIHGLAQNDRCLAKDTVESADLNLESPELGFINFLDGSYPITYYFTRAPYRRYKQGLCRDNMLITGIGSTQWRRPDNAEIFCKHFEHMLLDKFPGWKHKKVQETLSLTNFERGYPSIAFSRQLAVEIREDGVSLFVENQKAGFLDTEENKFRLTDNFCNTVIQRKLEIKGIPCHEPC